jgi:nucleoside-diphosphate-sugar epimerase
MKKAIVSGATGFIGSSFVQYLGKKGIEVLALGRKNIDEITDERRQKLKHAKYIKLDMSEIFRLEEKILTMDWIVSNECVFFNLAWGGENSLSDLNIEAQLRNVAWSISALEVAKKVGCSRFIQIGTMEEAFTQKYLELDHHKNNQYNRHVIYSVAKIEAKNALKIKSSQLDIDYIYVLHSHVMGPDDGKDSFLQVTLQKLIRGDELTFSTGEQYFDVISVSDCCLGYYLICQKGRSRQEYWVGSGDPRRLREYVERMYAMFPSKAKMQFGRFQYNDIVLDREVFAINNLTEDTGYKPTMTYEQTVKNLHDYLLNHSAPNTK